MTQRAYTALVIGLMLTSEMTATGQILRIEADILSPGDEGYDGIPENLLVLDVFVDVASTDVWTAAGTWMTTHNGARFVYFDRDQNSPGIQPGLIDPGLENRFATSLSRPRPRNANIRFTNAGAALAGGYLGGTPSTASTLIDVAYFASPPATPSSPSVDGYIARIAVDLAKTGYRPDQLFVTLEQPSTPILLACEFPFGGPGFAVASFDVPSLTGIDFWVTVPEPTTPVLFSIALLASRAAHRRSQIMTLPEIR